MTSNPHMFVHGPFEPDDADFFENPPPKRQTPKTRIDQLEAHAARLRAHKGRWGVLGTYTSSGTAYNLRRRVLTGQTDAWRTPDTINAQGKEVRAVWWECEVRPDLTVPEDQYKVYARYVGPRPESIEYQEFYGEA